jgi:DNA-binding NtrC family response regulator
MDKTGLKILFVQVSGAQADNLSDKLLKENSSQLEISRAFDLKSALSNLELQSVDIVLLDLDLPDSLGLDTFLAIEAKFPKIPVVIICREQDESLAKQALQKGARDYLFKEGLDHRILFLTLKRAFENKKNQIIIDEFKENYFL